MAEKTEAELRVAIYEKFLNAIAFQKHGDMYQGELFHPVLESQNPQLIAQTALQIAGTDPKLFGYQ